ncbi:plasmid pRiA4b ORF-3 family protein [Bradyrhizobium sp. CW7]|uniref:plasmid pRiA4b ORF-3 family protein n=1 Tax=Bradyrhizobium sp. CW7 TaxID=2782688 RepID=UPI001FFA6C92|nr:plasmid pRiA4b ORF-3 family protein [Bradyrhizobium sp. CW7]
MAGRTAIFEFFAGEARWGIPDPHNDYGHQPMDASKARLCDIVRETGAKTIHYLYDFGDSWDHVIKLEKWFENTTTEGLPFLLEAAGRCPPEDVGGAPGYAEYLEAIRDPARTYAPPGSRAVRSQRSRPEGARSRRQRVVRHMETAATRHANKK